MNFLLKIIFPCFISVFVYSFFLFFAKHPEIEIAFFAFIGACLSFLIFQITQFYIRKFLEKQLTFSDFIYIKKAFLIFFPYLFCLFNSLIFLILDAHAKAYLVEQDNIRHIPITSESIGFWIFFLCTLIISFRIEVLAKKLINLQLEKFD